MSLSSTTLSNGLPSSSQSQTLQWSTMRPTRAHQALPGWLPAELPHHHGPRQGLCLLSVLSSLRHPSLPHGSHSLSFSLLTSHPIKEDAHHLYIRTPDSTCLCIPSLFYLYSSSLYLKFYHFLFHLFLFCLPNLQHKHKSHCQIALRKIGNNKEC